MLHDVVRDWEGETFNVGLTSHVLRRYRRRVKSLSKTRAKGELTRLLKTVPLDTPKKGGKRYIRFQQGILVLIANKSATKWVAVTVLRPWFRLEKEAVVIEYEKQKKNLVKKSKYKRGRYDR